MANDDYKGDDYIQSELQMFNLYINLINIDGKIRDEEVEAFHDLINNSDIEESLKNELIRRFDAESYLSIDYESLKNKTYNERFEIVMSLIQLAAADNEIPQSEMTYIMTVAENLKLDDDQVRSLIREKYQH